MHGPERIYFNIIICLRTVTLNSNNNEFNKNLAEATTEKEILVDI